MLARYQRAQITDSAKKWFLVLAAANLFVLALLADLYARVAYFDVGGTTAGALAAGLWGLAITYALTGVLALAARLRKARIESSPLIVLIAAVLAFSATLPLTLALELSPPLSALLGLALGGATLLIGLVWIGWAHPAGGADPQPEPPADSDPAPEPPANSPPDPPAEG